jgi:hypothetical protein
MPFNRYVQGMTRVIASGVGLLALAGCAPTHGSATAVHLQDLAGYPVLVPGSPSVSAGLSQATVVRLGIVESSKTKACEVKGRVFSLAPSSAAGVDRWTVASPSPQGWQTPPPDVDLRTEWLGFVRSLSTLQAAGCFRAAMTAARVQQMITESISVPADESLVFRYGFTGSGVVDLLPGMMVQVERSLLVDRGARRELQSMEADYEVLETAGGGVTLHRTRAASLHRPETSDEIFHLERLTGSAPMLRLFLQNAAAGDTVQRPSVLLAASRMGALEEASRTVDKAGCSRVPTTGVKCITFHEAVSLLIACRVNGKQQYLPLGTALTSLIDMQKGSLATAVVERRQSDGRYASVVFPQTQEAAVHIILQNGDSIRWK